jgi:hypothetical protein
MTKIRVNKKLGPMAMAIFMILVGLSLLLKLSFEGFYTLMGILALIAGILGLLEID